MLQTSVGITFGLIWLSVAAAAQTTQREVKLDTAQGLSAIEELKREGRFDSLVSAYRSAVSGGEGGTTQVRFEANGPVFSTLGRDYSMELVGFGKDASVHSEGSRTEYRRSGITEWYVKGNGGIEQGFTVDKRPGTKGPLTLTLRLGGDFEVVAQDGGAIFRDGNQAFASYSGLKSWDSTGRRLAGHMEVSGREVRLLIDDSGASYPVAIDPWILGSELTAIDEGGGYSFGSAIALSGNTALIGAINRPHGCNCRVGSAYIFTNSGSGWVQQAELTPPPDDQWYGFGWSVALSGDTALIGAYESTVDGLGQAGAVYVFTRNGSIWTQQVKLTAPDNAQGLFFGSSVSLSGDTALIGAYGKVVNGYPYAGAAYVFTLSGSSWTQQAELITADSFQFDQFGWAVALDGDTALISANTKGIYPYGPAGAAYIFTRAGSTWSQQAKLSAPDGVSNRFGISLALYNGTAIIGSYNYPSAAYIFTGSGSSWSLQDVLYGPPLGALGTVALVGDTAIIGDISGNGGAGSVYIYTRTFLNDIPTWSYQATLNAPDAALSDFFGSAVAIDGGTLLIGAMNHFLQGVGANGGAVYSFTNGGQPASIIATVGTPQNTNMGGAFTIPLQALVTDPGGHPVAGTTVTFTAPTSGPSASFNSSPTATVTTDANGIATAPTPIANAFPGTYSVTASVTGVSVPAVFTLTNISPGGITVGFSSNTVVGGKAVTGKLNLLTAAPVGGLIVNLSSSNPTVATVPPTVTVSAGAKVANFSISASPVGVDSTVVIYANTSGLNGSGSLVVNAPVVSSMKVAPASVIGSVSATGNTVTLAGMAPAGGITVQLTSSDPAATPPATVVVPGGESASSAFAIPTAMVTTVTTVTITATYNGVSKTDTLVVNPLAVSTLTLAPATLSGGASSTSNRVKLNAPALPSGAVVTLSSDTPAAAAVPTSIIVAAGSTTSPDFTITTSPVTTPTAVTITATYNGISTQALLTVNPAALASLKIAPVSVVGSVAATGNTITLTSVAPGGGVTVQLTSSDPSAIPPATVLVPAGQSISPAFVIPTTMVSSATSAIITATYGGISKTDTLVVNPLGVSTLTLAPATISGGVSSNSNRVKLNAPALPSGAIVSLSSDTPTIVSLQASVTIAAGSTTSPDFSIATAPVTTRTAVTITATYNSVSVQSVLTVNPASLSAIKVSPASLVGTVAATATLTVSGLAPSGGTTIQLTSSDPAATPPATVVIPAGQSTSSAFPIPTAMVPVTTSVTITATYSGISKTDTLLINPMAVSALTLSPATVQGGASSKSDRVKLNAPAPPVGAVVTLSSDTPGVVTLPASITVAAGATTSADFTIATSPVLAPTSVIITATYNGIATQSVLTVTP